MEARKLEIIVDEHRNNHVGRREFLKSLGVAGVSALALSHSEFATTSHGEEFITLRRIRHPNGRVTRKGPDVKVRSGYVIDYHFYGGRADNPLKKIGYMAFDTTNGSDVYAAANGVVANVEENRNSGYIYINILHGLWRTIYGNLLSPLVVPGQVVTRKDKIGVAGAVSQNMSWLGPYLGFGIATNSDFARLIKSYSIERHVGYSRFDPLEFVANLAVDSNSNWTVPYWHGPAEDGTLDELFAQHYESLGFGDLLKKPFRLNDLRNVPQSQLKELLSVPVPITAPLADPERIHLYK